MATLLKPDAAGAQGRQLGEQTTALCMEIGERPPTPPHVQKWRKSMYENPGQRVVHPGMIGDFKADKADKVRASRQAGLAAGRAALHPPPSAAPHLTSRLPLPSPSPRRSSSARRRPSRTT